MHGSRASRKNYPGGIAKWRELVKDIERKPSKGATGGERRSERLDHDVDEHEGHTGRLEELIAPGQGRRRRVSVLGWCGISAVILVVGLVIAGGFFLWFIQRERGTAFLRERFVAAVKGGIGPQNELMLDEAGIRIAGLSPTFSISGLAISNATSGAYAELERADFRLTGTSLLALTPEARSITFEGLKLVLPRSKPGDPPLGAEEALTLLHATLGAVNFAVSGQDPAFASLTTITGKNISLFQRREDDKVVPLQAGLTIAVTRGEDGTIRARVEQTDHKQAIEFIGRNELLGSGERLVQVDSDNLTAGALFGILGQPVKGIDPGLKLSFRLHSRIGSDAALAETGASLTARGGRIEPPDPDMPPFQLDEAALDLRLKAGEKDILIDRFQLRFNETNIMAIGRMTPLGGEQAGYRLSLKAGRADIDRLTPEEPILSIDSLEATGVLSPSFGSFRLERLALAEDDGKLLMDGLFSLENGGLIETNVEASGVGIRKALRIWPVWVAPNVRRWLVERVSEGHLARLQLRSKLQGESLANAFRRLPIADDALHVEYELSGVTIRPVLDALPIDGVHVRGRSTGRKAEVSVIEGAIRPDGAGRVDIRNATLSIADTAQRPAVMAMKLPIKGDLRGLMAYLSSGSLKAVIAPPGDVEVSGGMIEGEARITLPISRQVAAKDVRIDIQAGLKQVSIEKAFRGERLEGGQFELSARNDSAVLKGEGTVSGVSNKIELRMAAGKPSTATVRSTMDDAQLARRGIEVRPLMAGTFGVAVTTAFGDNAPIEIELDLAKARIDAPLAPLAKKAGAAGKMRFTVLNRNEAVVLDKFEADFGAVSARGRLEFNKDNQLTKADFASLKLSPGDVARLTVERNKNVYRVSLRGNSFDVRPFSSLGQNGKSNDRKPENGGDIELDLQSTVLVGFNGELLSAADVKLVKRNGDLRELTVKGRFGGETLTIATVGRESDGTRLAVETTDGGALARFLDIYAKAHGGRMHGDLVVSSKGQRGIVQMRDFVIRGEPALKQARASAQGTQGPGVQSLPTGNDQTQFTKFRADFVREQGALILKEAVMWGGEIGGTLEGTLDYARDRVSLQGAFVPAYALNNLFAQVPIIGRILGGGQYEGLFAVPFVVSGRASAPVLRTNPVSAIAPGFLRKFFEIQREK